MKKQLAILGSTGSIGTQTLQVVEDNLPAVSLYSSLGFQQYYTDWFRVRRLL